MLKKILNILKWILIVSAGLMAILIVIGLIATKDVSPEEMAQAAQTTPAPTNRATEAPTSTSTVTPTPKATIAPTATPTPTAKPTATPTEEPLIDVVLREAQEVMGKGLVQIIKDSDWAEGTKYWSMLNGEKYFFYEKNGHLQRIRNWTQGNTEVWSRDE